MAQYFVGITLPAELENEVEAFRRRFHAPRTVPHITVIPPFRWMGPEGRLLRVLRGAVASLIPFWVRAKGIGHFGSRVIFVQVEASSEIIECHEAVRRALESAGVTGLREEKEYHPHITLATRLTPAEFEHHKDVLAEYNPSAEFACTRLTLFKMEQSARYRRWNIHRQIDLGEKVGE